ncbi:helix-turn-helix domain-containing protein [Ellagibacter isourolithinifaciens]|uniref:helix-turn-helix domain-containing protein n=3 Tax=Eggerthellales TaxID=1643822 RepID=UPI003AAC1382
MAHTAGCAAPEGNQDRDEWMTVIEMQEYMRASRNKAYDLIWSGEIDSYRLGRKLLVSRASVDAYIESRSGRKRYIATKPPTTCSRWAHTPTRR